MAKAKKTSKIKRRNPVATHPMLRKGGVHGPSKKAIRRQRHVALKRGDYNDP